MDNRCWCGRESVEGLRSCQYCRDKAARRKRLNRKPGNKELNAQRSKRRKAESLAKGLCTRCNKLPLISNNFCQECLDKSKSRHTRKTTTVYAAYGNKCACPPCGETRRQFLTLDHINNDGHKHRKEGIKGGSGLCNWAVRNNFPLTLRLLCSNCNIGRWRNGGVCPHLEEMVSSSHSC